MMYLDHLGFDADGDGSERSHRLESIRKKMFFWVESLNGRRRFRRRFDLARGGRAMWSTRSNCRRRIRGTR